MNANIFYKIVVNEHKNMCRIVLDVVDSSLPSLPKYFMEIELKRRVGRST